MKKVDAVPDGQSIAIVMNPAKLNLSVLKHAIACLDNTRFTIYKTSKEDPGRRAAEEALEDGANVVVAAGGDGTVRAVAEVVVEKGTSAALGIIPAGTGNLLARNLRIPLGDVGGALKQTVAGDTRRIDVGRAEIELNGTRQRHTFLVMAGFGLDAHMIDKTNETLKNRVGWLAYLGGIGRAVKESKIVGADVAVDGRSAFTNEVHTLMVANFGSMPGGLELLPEASAQDGFLDLLMMTSDSPKGWMDSVRNIVWDNGIKRRLARKTEGATVGSDAVQRASVRTVDVSLEAPRTVQLDGDSLGKSQNIKFTLHANALRVRC